MNKYEKYLSNEMSEDVLLESLFEFVKKNEIEPARFIAAKIDAIREIKFELMKIDKQDGN